ncbi:MAG: hypothetical protein AAB281_00620 [Actinomycetota bacterium]
MNSQSARSTYVLNIFPAGRNARVAEITDGEGNIIRLIHCPFELGNTLEERLDTEIRRDWETMDSDTFAEKYRLNRD